MNNNFSPFAQQQNTDQLLNPMINEQQNNENIPQQTNNDQIVSITQDLNKEKVPNIEKISEEDLLAPEPSQKKNLKSFIYKVIIILFVYLIFSTTIIKKIFSKILTCFISDENDNISYIGLIIYGFIMSVVCVALEYLASHYVQI